MPSGLDRFKFFRWQIINVVHVNGVRLFFFGTVHPHRYQVQYSQGGYAKDRADVRHHISDDYGNLHVFHQCVHHERTVWGCERAAGHDGHGVSMGHHVRHNDRCAQSISWVEAALFKHVRVSH